MLYKYEQPNGDILCYNDDKHYYFFEKDPTKRVLAVTQFVGKFFPKFDFEGVSEKYAAKNDLDVEEVRKMWRNKGKLATTFGDACHAYSDHLCRRLKPPKPNDDREKLFFNVIKRLLKKMFSKYSLVGTELVIGSYNLGIGGTLDLVLRSKTKDEIVFVDWKTGDMTYSNRFQTALPPIDDLDDSKFNKYCLQLNTYNYIAKKEKYFNITKDTISTMCIVHLSDIYVDNFNFILVPSMQDYIEKMLGSIGT